MGTSLQCLRKMFKCAIVLLAVSSQCSAVIQSHRLGGNFAYSTHEAHAYAVQTPVIGHRTVPVGVTYHQGTPIVKSSTNYTPHQIPRYGLAYNQYATVGAVPYHPYAVAGAPFVHAAPAVAAVAVDEA